MKIVYCVNEDNRSGTYFRVHGLAVALKKRGHEICILSQHATRNLMWKIEERDGIRYELAPSFAIPRFVPNNINPINLVMRALQHLPKADIYHLFQPFLPGFIPWARAGRKWQQLVRIYDWDDYWWNSWERQQYAKNRNRLSFNQRLMSRARNKLERKLPSWADAVTTCSHGLMERAQKRGAKRVHVVPNGSVSTIQHERQYARQRLNLEPQNFYLGFAGWTFMQMDWCLKLLCRIRSVIPGAKIACCGADPASIGLQSAIEDRSIHYIGILSQADSALFCQAVDVLLLPLLDNDINRCRFPMKFAEYAASGTPVLCSAVGECARWIPQFPQIVPSEPNEQGWLDAGEKMVKEILAGKRPPKHVNVKLGKLDWNVIAEDLEQFYQSIMRFP